MIKLSQLLLLSEEVSYPPFLTRLYGPRSTLLPLIRTTDPTPVQDFSIGYLHLAQTRPLPSLLHPSHHRYPTRHPILGLTIIQPYHLWRWPLSSRTSTVHRRYCYLDVNWDRSSSRPSRYRLYEQLRDLVVPSHHSLIVTGSYVSDSPMDGEISCYQN